MRFPVAETQDVDCLIVGSGMAGLSLALTLAEREKGCSVMVASKGTLCETATSKAQGGIAAVLSPEDSVEHHVSDTLKAGRGLCDRDAVEYLVQSGLVSIKRLVDWGMLFDETLGREGGHSKRRVAHAADATGAEVQNALIRAARKHVHIDLREKHFAMRLLVQDGKCTGALFVDLERKTCVQVNARIVVLATGGAGRLWKHTSNPHMATGDGIWLAYEAGAQLVDMEFLQFHPTTLAYNGSGNFLLTEALRGEGAHLVDGHGKRLMASHPQKELAPRDVVSQSIWAELHKPQGRVFLDVRHLGEDFLRKRFPTVYAECERHGLNPCNDLLPITPAAHYLCGGIRTALSGRTSLDGLYAIGECACTGVHGANRLASNSLLEGIVFARAAAADILAHVDFDYSGECRTIRELSLRVPSQRLCRELRVWLRRSMWEYAGLVRIESGLRTVLADVKRMASYLGEASVDSEIPGSSVLREMLELRGMIGLSRVIASAALAREESRGCHQRSDFPGVENNWKRHVVVQRGKNMSSSTTASLQGTEGFIHKIDLNLLKCQAVQSV